MSSLAIEQQRDRRKSMIATILFHAVLIVLFLFFGLQQPYPLPEETGVEIAMADFGTSFSGSGNVETPNPGEQEASAAAAASESTPEDVAVDDASDVAVTKPEEPKKPKPTETPKPKPEPEKPKEPTIDNKLAEALNTWGKGGGGGEGDSDKPGNQGIESGKPDGAPTTMTGDGWSISLGGRGLVRGPNITDRPNIDRRSVVVITIKVDREGKVTSAYENLSKSNTTSQVLFNIAKKAARMASFTAKPDGAYEQQGEMTFVFDPQ